MADLFRVYLVPALCLCAAVAAAAPADEANLFVGTAGSGHTTPAACRPFSSVQAGPDTGVLDWKYCSGYQYGDTSLFGFSSSHISGSGCADLGDVLLLPFTREFGAPRRKFDMDKSSERAVPGYYSVKLPGEGVLAEMTATPRVALYRFSYPERAIRRLMVDLQHGVVVWGEHGVTNRVLECSASVLPDKDGLDAALRVASWTTRRFRFRRSSSVRMSGYRSRNFSASKKRLLSRGWISR